MNKKTVRQESESVELELLQEVLDLQRHNLRCYSKSTTMELPKVGFEKEWEHTKDNIETLIRIMKIVYADTQKIQEDSRKNLCAIVEKLLNESASAYISTDAGMIELKIIDETRRNILAKIKIKLFFRSLLFKEFQFY